jgi:hypothetical protein
VCSGELEDGEGDLQTFSQKVNVSARFLRFVIQDGYDDFVAVYSAVVDGSLL